MKKHFVMLLITALLISFTACSTPDTGEVVSDSEVTKISDMLTNDGVWILCSPDTLAKDTPVISVVEINNGNITNYPMGDITVGGDVLSSTEKLTLGDVVKMTDEEILTTAKERQAASVKKAFSDDNIKAFLDDWEKAHGFNDNRARYDAALTSIKDTTDGNHFYNGEGSIKDDNIMFNPNLKIAIVTDESGNNTVSEYVCGFASKMNIDVDWDKVKEADQELPLAYCEDALIGIPMHLDLETFYTGFTGCIYPEPIYDGYFGGFYDDDGNYLLKVCSENDEFMLDEPGDKVKGVAVDPADMYNYMNGIEE